VGVLPSVKLPDRQHKKYRQTMSRQDALCPIAAYSFGRVRALAQRQNAPGWWFIALNCPNQLSALRQARGLRIVLVQRTE